jgi:hypothetical protein
LLHRLHFNPLSRRCSSSSVNVLSVTFTIRLKNVFWVVLLFLFSRLFSLFIFNFWFYYLLCHI